MSAPGGIALDYTYDGYLKTGATWSGPVEGSLETKSEKPVRGSALARRWGGNPDEA